ncbi:11961_t:CDS:2 [Ambispora leptoticha]|uniref:11961_t:CDS:1 n=1 Tax=Ambispora leptoticha TaxID=144679 RepID=A0A9N9BFF6_9GLOM|nr:11961_t:CDS:2 [Ambispora leptoticha]
MWYKRSFDRVPKGLKPLPEPPGKKLIIGHLKAIGLEPHRRFKEWREHVGDIFMVQMGQERWIILNNMQLVNDLLQKRDWEIIQRKRLYAGSPNNEWFRKITPLVHGALNNRRINSYTNLINECTLELLQIFHRDGQTLQGLRPQSYLSYTNLNIMLNVIFAIKAKGIDDPLYKLLIDLSKRAFEFGTMKHRIFNFFPILRWVLSRRTTLKNAIQLRDDWETTVEGLLTQVKNDRDEKPCVARDLLKKLQEGRCDEFDVIHLSIGLINAGTETTSTALNWVIALLAKYPEYQARAHEELDRVIGKTRLPIKEDEPSLDFIRSFIKESMRWAAPLNFGVPHYIEEDDEYMEYHIPKNSLVVLANYSIHTDETRYKNANTFDPTRFLGIKESSAVLAQGKVELRDHFAFGAGRRLCSGIHLAEAELFLVTSRILWAFRIEPGLQSDGVTPTTIDLFKYTNKFTVCLDPYNVRFVPRHENVDSIIYQENSN